MTKAYEEATAKSKQHLKGMIDSFPTIDGAPSKEYLEAVIISSFLFGYQRSLLDISNFYHDKQINAELFYFENEIVEYCKSINSIIKETSRTIGINK